MTKSEALARFDEKYGLFQLMIVKKWHITKPLNN